MWCWYWAREVTNTTRWMYNSVSCWLSWSSYLLKPVLFYFYSKTNYRGADKSLARPGRKQVTNSNFCKPLKKKNSEVCPSNQISAAAMTSASVEKWRTFNCFFSRVGLRTYQQPCSCTIFQIYLIFGTALYMERAGTCSISFPLASRQQNLYDTYLMLCVQS